MASRILFQFCWRDFIIITAVSILAAMNCFAHSGHKNLTCPLVHVMSAPKNLAPCNGVNRSSFQSWDDRLVFDTTGREALTLIDAIRDARGDCSKAVIDGKQPIPLLNIRFNSESFRSVAETAIRTANLMSDFLTKGACSGDIDNSPYYGDPTANISDKILFSLVRNNIQTDGLMFGSGIWFLKGKYKGREYFAPYAYKKKSDQYLRVKDLSTTWGSAHTNFLPFLERLAKNRTFLCKSSYFSPTTNRTADGPARFFTHPVVDYSDGLWGRPYFECSTTRAWIVGYFVPFFATRYNRPADDPIEVMGVATVDIDLNKVDINQCDLDSSSKFTYKIFAGTHHCKNETTKCVHISGGGFAVGSYRCECKAGYYFPVTASIGPRYFNGTVIENDLSKNNGTEFNKPESFQCIRCREGCKTCIDNSPCIYVHNEELRFAILGLSIFCILLVIGLFGFVWRYKDIMVVKSASPMFLMISLCGACLMYIEVVILFPEPNTEFCTVSPWLRQIGFVLMYGSVLLKTWRVSLIFKIRVAKRIKVTDIGLLQRLIPLVLSYVVYLVIWTVAGHPVATEYLLDNKVRFIACTENWWDHSIVILDILLLFWGIHLCYTVRKAPTPFNESKYISWSIYNMTLVTIFMKLIKTFLIKQLGPNITYILEFVRVQLGVTVLVVFVFFPKIIRITKGRGNQDSTGSRTKSGGGSSDGTLHLVQENENLKAEITRLHSELETMKHARIDAGNRPLNRNGSIGSPIAPDLRAGSAISLRSGNEEAGLNTSTSTLANGWRHGGSQFFSPAAELVSDFV